VWKLGSILMLVTDFILSLSGHSQPLSGASLLILAYSVPESRAPQNASLHGNPPEYANANVNAMLFHGLCECMCPFVAHSHAVQHIPSPINHILSFHFNIRPVETAIRTSPAKQTKTIHPDAEASFLLVKMPADCINSIISVQTPHFL
jgi:hypothetical protein